MSVRPAGPCCSWLPPRPCYISDQRMPIPVILVDDDALYREAVTADLEDRGFAVAAFADGPALLAALDEHTEAELVLVDWTLPHLSGLDLLRALRRRGCRLPVAFLTGRSGVERTDEARA